MEGKAVLFKRLADIDVFDLEIKADDPEDVIKFCQQIEPTFGAINLEDIKAPDCFYIEETLRKTLSIPVFHDDQHGTAIISGAALLNALEVADKKIDQVRIAFSGAGAAGIASAEHFIRLGARRENITMCNVFGVIYEGRTEGLNPYNARFAIKTGKRTLAEAMKGADVFVGLSVGGCVTQEMVRSMADRPIIFALANPDPEISYPAAREARPDAIIATGRSDYPNQVNNLLGFPFIFRGALDVRARAINEAMEIAATKALAGLAKQDVPDSVMRAYGGDAPAFRTRVHHPQALRLPRPDLGIIRRRGGGDEDRRRAIADRSRGVPRGAVAARIGRSDEVMQSVATRRKAAPKRIVFSKANTRKSCAPASAWSRRTSASRSCSAGRR